MERFAIRPAERFAVRGPGELIGGASGPSIRLSDPDFGGSTYYEGVDDNDITVTLRDFAPLASYSVTVASDGGGTPPAAANGTADANGDASEVINITGLNPGQVTFTATAGAEMASRTATLEAQAAPSAPINLVATHGDTEVGLSWDAPASINGAVITDYVIEVDSGGGFSTITDGVNTNTTYTHTGLTNGTEYTYRVSAVNSIGTGAASAPASATPCATPDQVGTVTPTAGNNQVALAWSAPGDGGSPITDYVVQYRETGSGVWLTDPDGVSSATGATVTGLANGTEYEFQVAAVNAEGQGAFSAAATATTNDVPAQVGAVTPTAGNGEVALAWSAPAANGNAITDYIVQYKLSSSGTWITDPDGTSATTGATITGLVNDSAYDFRVAAVNALGTGAYSATVSATPADSLESQAAAVAAKYTDVAWLEPGSASIATDGTGGQPGSTDSIGRFVDKSSAGNDFRATGTNGVASDSARAVYTVDGDYAYADVDGVDDWYQPVAGQTALDLGTQYWHVGCWVSNSSGRRIFSNSSGSTNSVRDVGTNSYRIDTQTSISSVDLTAPHVLTVERDSDASATGRFNGAAGTTVDPSDAAGTQGLALFSAENDRWNGGMSGRFYGGMWGTGTLTSEDRATLEAYFASLAGVTLA